jgi:hypothetical protein
VLLSLRSLSSAIGAAGDTLYVPLALSGGRISGLGLDSTAITGSDFVSVYADEKLLHHGQFVVADEQGDIVFWYTGTSRAQAGAYDSIIEGRAPGRMPCRLSMRVVSTREGWRSLDREPLLGVGTFDGRGGTLDVTLLRMPEADGEP